MCVGWTLFYLDVVYGLDFSDYSHIEYSQSINPVDTRLNRSEVIIDMV